ncbi:MAG: phenylacetate--CoA ligase family protein [Planctomycetaceae bacterium]|nr:MAG: phenylacetate--CoA ligase family protein [Planctomycetaceae bacterium]
MSPWLTRKLALPLHEWLLGRPTFRILNEIRPHGRCDPAEMIAAQRARLQQVFDHARRHIPWWRNRLDAAPQIVEDPREALAGVPVLTRTEIQNHLEEMRWPDPPVKLIKHISGGTTDDNLEFYCGRERQTWNRAVRYRALERLGVRPGDPELHLWPHFPADSTTQRFKDLVREVRDWVTNDTVLDLRPFSDRQFERAIGRLSRYQRTVLFAYPSWVLRLADYWKRRQSSPVPGLGCVYCTGEVLHDSHRNVITRILGVPVYEEYGSQETGSIANEDSDHAFRLNTEHVLVEILRAGKPAAPGELGEIVVTNLTAVLMPFIRYATGDVARQPADPSFPVNDGLLPLFPRVEGRTSDLLLSTDGRLLPSRPLVDDLVTEARLEWFHLHQTSSSRVELHLLTSSSDRRPVAETILRSHLGAALEIEVCEGTAFTPLRSGKHRFVCSPAAAVRIAHDRYLDDELARAWPQPVVTSFAN